MGSRRFRDLLREDLVALDLAAADKWAAIDALVRCCVAGGVFDPGVVDAILDAVLTRERASSTGLEDGIAVPHGFSPFVDDTIVVLGRVSPALSFDALDGKPTDLIVLIVQPDTDDGRAHHLRLLGDVARVLSDERLRQRVRLAGSAKEFIEAIISHPNGL